MKQFFIVLLAAFSIAATAQKKPKINKAKSALEDGNYAEAKAIIDAASTFEKVKDDPKTWYYRGMIYAVLDTTLQQEGALEEAIAAFDKALQMDPEQSKVSEFTATGIANVDTRRQDYYAYYYTKALGSYNSDDFSAASIDFEKAYMVNPSDTASITNAGYAALAAKDTERAKYTFAKALEAGSRDKNIYLQLYNFGIKSENLDEALSAIQKGKEAYPNDVEFMKYEVNILIQMDKSDEAREELEKAIEVEPDNPDLWFSLGVLKEETGDIEGAVAGYEQALEVDESHYNSNFNLAVMIFNNANELIKQRNDLSYKETTKSAELKKQIDAKLSESLPRWEKLYELKSTDETVLETLTYIYTALKMNDKAEKISDELDAVKGG